MLTLTLALLCLQTPRENLAWHRTAGTIPRNAVVFVLDDVGAVDLEQVSALGGTPNIDALAARGVRFTSAYANSICAPSRRSLFFGRYWVRGNGPLCGGSDANTPQYTEVSLFKTIPFHANAVLGKWHCGGDPGGGPWQCAPQAHGSWDWIAGTSFNVNGGGCGGTNYTNWVRVDDCRSALSSEYEPTAVRDAFLAGWPGAGLHKVAVVSTNLAHGPFHKPPAELLPPGWVHVESTPGRYRSMIAAYDTIIGQMLDTVDLRWTMVVVVGDNGTPEQIAPRAKATCYERGINVPLIIAGGPVAPVVYGTEESELVHMVDVPATIAQWSGTGVPSTWDGVPLMKTLTGQDHGVYHDAVICGNGSSSIAARSHYFKLIDNPSTHPDEFYDLTMDPGESVNKLGAPEFVVEQAQLRAQIEAFKAR